MASQAAAAEPTRTQRGVDLIDDLLAVVDGDRIDTVRRARSAQRDETQAAYLALFEPAVPGAMSRTERFALGQYVAGLHRHTGLGRHYRALLRGRPDDGAASPGSALADTVAGLVGATVSAGPYGRYRETGLARESTDGPRPHFCPDVAGRLGPRLAAALQHAHLLTYRPREATPQALAQLGTAGWSVDGVVTLSQLVAFVSYQVRIVHALALLGDIDEQQAAPADFSATGNDAGTVTEAGCGQHHGPGTSSAEGRDAAAVLGDGAAAASGRDEGASAEAPFTSQDLLTYPDLDRPEAFTQEPLGWVPWLHPLAEADFTDRHYAGLVQRARAKNPYFALLARDPEVLGARTRADLDIFTNAEGGLSRAERELAAAATSRVNGCVFCAHVHARVAARESGRHDDIQRLLDDGVDARFDPEWNAVIDAATALAATPPALSGEHVQALHAAGLDDQAVADGLSAAAFFNWANRLMLSLGEPRVPRRR